MTNSEQPAANGHFDVLVLGPFALFRDGVALDTSGWQRKVHGLFRMLATTPERRRAKDELIDILWPEAPSEAGARNLRVVLHMLRRGLGGGEPSPVLSEHGYISLNPAYEWDIDLVRFEALIEQAGHDDLAALEEAAGSYRGEPLLEDRYDDWAIAVRGRIQRSWRELCLRLARLHQQSGEPDAAVAWFDRILESDPLDEEAMIPLLRALGELGRRTEALRRFQQFAQQLSSELDLTPSEEMLSEVARLRTVTERPRPSAKTSAAAPVRKEELRANPVIPRYPLLTTGRLVGREGELGRILWNLPPLNVVAPRLAVVSGRAGMGKTRLLAEVAARARRVGLLTLAGAAYQLEGQLLYGPIRDALSDYIEEQPELLLRSQLEGLLSDVARVVPELRLRLTDVPDTSEPAADQRLRLFLAVTKSFERIAQDSSLVLLLDDLQWADDATIQLLHFMVRRAGGNRMLIVAAFSEEEGFDGAARLTETLVSEGTATAIELGALACEHLRSILEERMRARVTDDLARLIHERSGGNPLQALRVLDELQARGELARRAEGWDQA